MEGVTKRLPHCIPKNRRTSGMPAPSSSTSTASSSSLATPPPPPLREILPAPPAPGKAPIILSPLASTSSSSFTTKVNGLEFKHLPSMPAAVQSHDVAASTPSFDAFPSAARKEESSMVVRRAAASAARKVLKQVAQEDSDASDMDISDSDDELTPFSDTRESTADPKSSESSRDSAGLYGRESATREDTKPILQAILLDLANIRKSAPAVMPPRKSERLFGLEHCPIYYPTETEFAQPLEYIERIAKQARDHGYGICKVVPPKGWQPPFSLDTETFRFGTRMQQLNSMEATARANLNFMEQLTIFHRQQKHSTFTIPIVMKKPLDLWRLRKEVTAAGGYSYVCDHRRWSHVGRQMGFDPDKDHGLTAVLRTAYKTIIQPFEDYRERVKTTLTPEGAKQALSSGSGMGMRTMASTSAQPGSTAAGKVSLATKAVTLDQVHAASAKLNEALNASPATKTISPKVAENMGGAFAHKEDLPPGEVCEICKTDEDEANILLCDDCDRGYHLGCLTPPLKKVPKEDWICDACIVNRGDDYGFEEGDEHTLSSFHQRATSFRHKWLAEHPVPGWEPEVTTLDVKGENWEREALVEDHVEREFWRLVESPTESVEVEYGADIHTTKWGSAAPTLEKDPKHPYARDGWNLTNLPILPGSVLRYVPSDICGMTVPWAYVGMMFSTFAWHKEDHNTYSVNYSHIGGTKTWYGVPGEDDEKLEAAMRAAAPELFEAQPDLMYQLVTLMSPGRLKEAGVRVSACDQRPNEFVITFPKAYHAGFNHDFNYNEAVNFCLPDWLHWDLEGVKKYKSISKTPVFSHDELLMTIYSYEDAPTSSRWLLPLFEEMISRELQERETARSSIPDLEVIVEDEQQDDDQYQCIIDKSFCYLSQITTEGHAQVACVNHWSQLPTGKKIMKIRYSDRDLKAMLLRVQKRATADTAEPVATAEKRKVLGDAMAAAVAELSAAKRAKSNLSSLVNGPAHVDNQASGAAVVDTGLCAA